MSRTTLLLIVVFVATVALLGFEAYLAFQPKPQPSPKANTQQIPVPNQSTPPANQLALPVGLTDAAINFATLEYNLSGTITSVRDTPQGTEVATDLHLRATALPKLTVNTNSPLFFVQNGNKTTAMLKDLKVNQKIHFHLSYALRRKVWTLKGVDIVGQKTATSSPASQQ